MSTTISTTSTDAADLNGYKSKMFGVRPSHHQSAKRPKAAVNLAVDDPWIDDGAAVSKLGDDFGQNRHARTFCKRQILLTAKLLTSLIGHTFCFAGSNSKSHIACAESIGNSFLTASTWDGWPEYVCSPSKVSKSQTRP